MVSDTDKVADMDMIHLVMVVAQDSVPVADTIMVTVVAPTAANMAVAGTVTAAAVVRDLVLVRTPTVVRVRVLLRTHDRDLPPDQMSAQANAAAAAAVPTANTKAGWQRTERNTFHWNCCVFHI